MKLMILLILKLIENWGAFPMVKLIVGTKGSGKTRKMINLANDQVNDAKGNLIFINKDKRLMYDLQHDIRFISVEDYDIKDVEGYTGFLNGIICSNHDIETIYIDSILKHANIGMVDVVGFLDKLHLMGEKSGLDFKVSISSSIEEMPEEIKKYVALN